MPTPHPPCPPSARPARPLRGALWLWALGLGAGLAGPAAAAPMTPEAFEQFTTGRIFDYQSGGALYGREQYLDGRRVIWSWHEPDQPAAPCDFGRWYPEDDRICFVYDGGGGPECWRFERAGEGMTATIETPPDPPETYRATPSARRDPGCSGPQVGA